MAYTEKKGSFRRNVIVTFLVISVISLASTGFVSLFFMDLIGGYTTEQSSDALEVQIKRNIELTAEKNALVIDQKLSNAEGMVEALAEECQLIMSSDSTFAPRETYYDYFFENQVAGLYPEDTYYDERYGIQVSWNYSSWYIPGSNSLNWEDYNDTYSDLLGSVSNLDYMFQYTHTQMPEFRWLYVGFENDMWINYPGSIVGDTDIIRNSPTQQFRCTDEDWYQDIRAGGGDIVYVGPYYDPIDNVLLISIGKAVYFENGTTMGIIAGDISVENIRNKILDVQVLDTGYAALITSDAGIVAHQDVDDADYAFYDPNLPALADFEELNTAQLVDITSGETGVIEFEKDSEDYILAYTPLEKGDYICIIVVPVAEAQAAIPALEARIQTTNVAATSFILFITIGGIVLAGIAAVAVSNQITKPLSYLMGLAMRNAEAMIKQQKMDTTDLQVDAEYTSKDDEIGELARAFQGMLDTIKDEDSQ